MIALNKWHSFQQKKLIVYNVPSHRAIDFISRNSYTFLGDKELDTDGVLKNFHLKPARISIMAANRSVTNDAIFHHNNFYEFHNKKILLIDTAISYEVPANKIHIDYAIVSGNPKLFISKIAAVFDVGTFIFDATNPLWKIDKWKKDCEELHLRFHSVPELGAFVTDL